MKKKTGNDPVLIRLCFIQRLIISLGCWNSLTFSNLIPDHILRLIYFFSIQVDLVLMVHIDDVYVVLKGGSSNHRSEVL